MAGYYNWIYNATPTPGRLQVNVASIGPSAVNNIYTLNHTGTLNNYANPYNFNTSKNYQFITNTVNLYAITGSFSINPAWSDELKYYNGMTASGNPGTSTQSFYHYSSPPTNISSNTRVRYKANGTFSNQGVANEGITEFELNEIDFRLQGFSYYKLKGSELTTNTSNSLGWCYDKSLDIYHWYDRISGSSSVNPTLSSYGYFPVGGANDNKIPSAGYRLNNCLIKFIPYSYFNFSFSYQNTGNFPLKIYTSTTQPSLSPSDWSNIQSGIYTPPAGSVLLATVTQSVSIDGSTSLTSSIPHSFYGVKGNQYLFFVGGFAGASASGSTFSSIYLKDIRVEGGYHNGNNKKYAMTTGYTYSTTLNVLSGATYSSLVGVGNTINATSSIYQNGISKIYSKIGNGQFKSGIWENGVWNSGWRVDEEMKEFHDINQFFVWNKNKRWRVEITGPIESVSSFNVGDNVSIGNIVAIDINEDRKLLKSYYTIISKTDNTIIVEFDNDFPIRRIEKDSDNHRIYITKNVWLSGGFLNGYFTGVWNYGLFKGYPLITEMYNTHWIDGIFDGGHFSSSIYQVPDFVDTVYQSGNVGLTFSEPHGLVVGDLITINKDDKTINSQYDGEHYVMSVVNNYQIVTDIEWGSDSVSESGSIEIEMNKGLLQKVDFKANNISKITSNTSIDSDAVFIYNSWMDLVYDDSYASNIGKPQTSLNNLSKRTYSSNNLYGYTTNDVLQSNSTFRDSYSTTIRRYKLGTKYKIFSDFIGDAGKFENNFNNTPTTLFGTSSTNVDSELLFTQYGWTFSRWDKSSLTFSSTEEIAQAESTIIGEELKVKAIGGGGILDITPFSNFDILNKTYQEIEKFRYTKIEFDLITFSDILSTVENVTIKGSVNSLHTPYEFNYKVTSATNYTKSPHIHFDNLNFTNRQITVGGVQTTLLYDSTYLPIYKNVNHILTSKKKKSEYFYNKRNLSMHFYGYSAFSPETIEYVIDNLHFYEVDMIPFFQYFTEENINKSIQVPYQGISPFIDYTNSNFNFIDIGLGSIQTQNSNVLVSGVGQGVSTNPPSNGFASGGFSDIRLKENIIKVGNSLLGINIYEWNYLNNKNRFRGVIAQELIGTEFESSLSIKDGFYWVDYTNLDVKFENI